MGSFLRNHLRSRDPEAKVFRTLAMATDGRAYIHLKCWLTMPLVTRRAAHICSSTLTTDCPNPNVRAVFPRDHALTFQQIVSFDADKQFITFRWSELM
jgi:hypothetical protein